MQYREFSFHANDNVNWLPPLESNLELSSKVEDKTQEFDKANSLEKLDLWNRINVQECS